MNGRTVTAIVGTIDDKGKIDTNDSSDVKRFVSTDQDEGVLVSVVTSDKDVLWCRYGITGKGEEDGASHYTELHPIRGGDEVLVEIPGGDPNRFRGIITHRLMNVNFKLAKEWNNDSHRIALGDYPVEITNKEGAFIILDKDGTLTYKHPQGSLIQFNAQGGFTLKDKDNNIYWSSANGLEAIAGGSYYRFGADLQAGIKGNMQVTAQTVNFAVGGMAVGEAPLPLVTLVELIAAITAGIGAAVPQDGGKAALGAVSSALTASGGTKKFKAQ